jgi:hypothetical protein
MRYRLRTLLILLVALPPVMAGAWLSWWKLVQPSPGLTPSRLDPKLVHMFRLDKVAESRAWEEAKAKSKELGAPQPVPLPEGY